MITRNDVFNQIKKMDQKIPSVQHAVLFEEIAANMSLPREPLMEMLEELETLNVIKINRATVLSVSLTEIGLAQSVVSEARK